MEGCDGIESSQEELARVTQTNAGITDCIIDYIQEDTTWQNARKDHLKILIRVVTKSWA